LQLGLDEIEGLRRRDALQDDPNPRLALVRFDVHAEDDAEHAQERGHPGLDLAHMVGGQADTIGEKVGVDPGLVAIQDLHGAP